MSDSEVGPNRPRLRFRSAPAFLLPANMDCQNSESVALTITSTLVPATPALALAAEGVAVVSPASTAFPPSSPTPKATTATTAVTPAETLRSAMRHLLDISNSRAGRSELLCCVVLCQLSYGTRDRLPASLRVRRPIPCSRTQP